MPTSQESAKSKSWSLRSMLGRRGSTKDKNHKNKNSSSSSSSNGRKSKSGVEESSQQSIKERVLAKLKEPLLPNACELKAAAVAAARHSVDSFRLEHDEEYGRYYSHSRYSISSSNLESSSYAFNQASTTANTPSSARSRSTALQAACSSPTSNVIARLMGLGDAQQITKPARNSIHLRRQQQQEQQQQQQRQDEEMWRSPRKSSLVEASPSQLLPKQQSRIGNQKRKDCAQDFLDEMEDHLRQCDKALERIEAVMQLKKKLLYLNNRAHNFDQHYNYNRQKDVGRSQLSRASSMDGRSDRHHREQQQQQAFTSMEVRLPHRSFQHRRSVSEGETPVFRPSAFDFELDISRSMEAHRDSFRKRAETATVESDHSPRTPVLQHKQLMKTTPKISVGEAGAAATTSESNSEQPSPVSVLDNNNPGYDSASEDDRDSTHKEIRESNNHSAVEKKKFVVRALWRSEESSADSTTTASTTTDSNRSSNKVDDAEVMKRIDGIWSRGMQGEISEVAMVVEGIIFRRLVEETIDDLLCFALP